ncbi:hypothetical protein [Bacillus cihuensis]|uniref:hypothetical protein n=1 Tax=Bacillus cihuensis TaxID=1208599 RepID=UPI0003F97F8D|nr:hypothetical protein [Bacillus cihuensis]
MKPFVCHREERKQEVIALLTELNIHFEFIEENEIKIFGKTHIYGTFLSSGHVHLEKESKRLNRRVHKWPCAGMQAITSYLKQHAL